MIKSSHKLFQLLVFAKDGFIKQEMNSTPKYNPDINAASYYRTRDGTSALKYSFFTISYTALFKIPLEWIKRTKPDLISLRD
jgi:hypothetical protein